MTRVRHEELWRGSALRWLPAASPPFNPARPSATPFVPGVCRGRGRGGRGRGSRRLPVVNKPRNDPKKGRDDVGLRLSPTLPVRRHAPAGSHRLPRAPPRPSSDWPPLTRPPRSPDQWRGARSIIPHLPPTWGGAGGSGRVLAGRSWGACAEARKAFGSPPER